MFNNAVWNVVGDVPFNENKFPILIELVGVEGTVLCKKPDDVPRGVDFKLTGTCIATITEEGK